jgi:hypothetical protein
MSTKFMVKKGLHALIPVSADGQEFVGALAKDALIWVEASQPRNVQHHRKFFALLKVVRDATGAWDTEAQQLIDLKFNMGHTERVRVHDTSKRGLASNSYAIEIPKSISFAKMDQHAFEEFYEHALAKLCEIVGGDHHMEDEVRAAVLEELGAA